MIPTLEAAFKRGGVHLVTVPIDYSETTRVLVEELRERMPAQGRLASAAVGGAVRPFATRDLTGRM